VTLPGALTEMVVALDREQIPYMLTGSLATSYHGTPRATQDIDVVISPSRAQLVRLLASLSKDKYDADEGTALAALDTESQFNVIDLQRGWKIDFIIRRSRPFSRAEFERRMMVEIEGFPLVVATAEDVLLAKLEWAQLGRSERQLDDVAGVLRVRGDELDLPNIERWVADLGLEAEWARARGRVGLT
jgi:hypothetical protein